MPTSTPPDARQAITLWALDLAQHIPPAITPRVPAAFHRLGLDDVAGRALVMGISAPAESMRRLRDGRRCYVALVSGLPVAHAWVTVDGGEEDIGEVGLRLRLAPRGAYIWDCATAVSHRRRLLFTALLAHVAAELRAEGYACIWIGAGNDNVASRRGIAHAGFQPVADVVVASSGPNGVQLPEVRGVPGVPEHLVAAARAALRPVVERTAISVRTSCRAEHAH